ncbi:hypothetical protein J3R30DRAFT_3477488 [Lentinula aciculospora]|uniref:BTB domain-containing protein n=1 Tax=Lentinula aciculospora TaxID=153920 RepID=A0A9W9DP17_9AGAR|nr:hypothetical protein J3R30DRAFT_3477488 [Lentinula aciculospora]
MSTTPLSSSPNRTAWTASPSLLRYSHRSSTSSLSSAGPFPSSSSVTTPNSRPPSTSGWSNLALKKQSTGNTMAYAGAEETTKSWTFVGFEWVVRDVHKLRDFVEGVLSLGSVEGEDSTPIEADDFDILKHSPVIGDGKFKLEIARTAPTIERDSTVGKPSGLALYITPLMLDFAHPQYELSATMMAGIKCQDDRAGERGARADWPFEVWHDWVFRQDNEVWECALPSLSTLLENSRISDTDSFVICVQIHCPVGPSLPAQPSVYYVPKDLLDGLEASLDNPNTGDVQFVCLERLTAADPLPSPNLTPEMSPIPRTRPSSSTSSISPFAPEMTARKRVIYAHSDILVHRSEYFATMLSSSFSENQVSANSDRKLFTVVVEEADFETIYWLLKYCYANWLLFKEVDDPRAAVEGVGRGWSVHWLHTRGGEWDWKTFPKHGPTNDQATADSRSVASGESLDGRRSPTGKLKTSISQTTQIRPPPSSQSGSRMSTTAVSGTQKNSPSSARVSPTAPTSSASRRVGSASSSIPLNMSASSSVRPKHVPMPLASVPPSNFPPAPHYPVSPHSQRSRGSSNVSASDPHMHPTPSPSPASALAMYQVAHRYAMPGLSALALEHMMNTITPASSFALLLATSAWDELKTLVEDYVVDKWDEVSVSEGFEVCCQEVAAGEWGPEGGITLMAIFRRLRSPTTIMYARS